jgi:arsenate reductase
MGIFQLIILMFFVPRQQMPQSSARFNKLYPILNVYVRDFPKDFKKIPEERRYRLNEIVYFLEKQQKNKDSWQVLFLSSDESAVGPMAQAWSKTAAYYFGFENFKPYTGGLVPGTISGLAIIALEKAGFIIYRNSVDKLDVYSIKYSYNQEPVVAFPKEASHNRNPKNQFMAVVIDRNADLNINNIEGTNERLMLEYEDPAGYVGSAVEQEKYEEVCKRVAVEMFYVFAQLRKRLPND